MVSAAVGTKRTGAVHLCMALRGCLCGKMLKYWSSYSLVTPDIHGKGWALATMMLTLRSGCRQLHALWRAEGLASRSTNKLHKLKTAC